MSEDVSVRPMAEVDITAGRSLLGQLGYDLTMAEMRRRLSRLLAQPGMPCWSPSAMDGWSG